VLASLVGFLGDFDKAEDAVQEAFAIAAERWPSRSPATWPARGRSTRFGPDANGGRRARFSATAQISRGEFGIDRWNRGGVVIGDKVSIGLEIEAVRQT
jgi:hypothetical protein